MLRCNGISGYAYQFEVLGGKGSSGPSADCNPPRVKRKVFFDSLFSSPELMKCLLSKGIYGEATLHANRSRSCPIPAEKDMKK